jgi:LmbE family N-acetylglucosaminyl deacetylase
VVTEDLLRALEQRKPIDESVAVVVAHPDDETVGVGPFLHLFRRLTLLHVTDGAPRDLRDVRRAGFANCADYAAARQRELRAALRVGRAVPSVASADPDPLLPLADQSASLHLGTLAHTLRNALQGVAAVFTHAYEGGHPDHDAVAFAVQATGIPVIEMPGYHAAPDGGIEVGRFLPNGAARTFPLNADERVCRDKMLACFTTQRMTLAPFFGWREQSFRPAPRYDFTCPPASLSYYDGFEWGMTSRRWCRLAARALRC